jgi:demethylmenaquinone methyltransferase/2-methoxy-6-polyprenyl-1,4-benzoquinol methylase
MLSLGRDRAWKRRLLGALPALDAPRCVDLACGTGDLAFLLAEKFPDAEIVGVDLTPEMLVVARQRSRHANVRFVQGDMCELDLPDAWADLVTGSYALRNAPDLDRALAEIHRVLKPGGLAAFLDFSKPPALARQRLQINVLTVWGSFWGRVLHDNPEAHAYIGESLRQFPDRDALRRKFIEHGLTLVRAESFYFGRLESLVLKKT